MTTDDGTDDLQSAPLSSHTEWQDGPKSSGYASPVRDTKHTNITACGKRYGLETVQHHILKILIVREIA